MSCRMRQVCCLAGFAARIGTRSAARALLMSMATFFAPSIAAHAQPAQIEPFIMATASTGGMFHQGGVTLSALIKLKLLPEHGIDLRTVNSSGSAENIGLLADDQVQFAIIQGLAGHEAKADGQADIGELRALTTLWPNVEHFIVRRQDAVTGNMADFLGLKGRKVSLGLESSAIASSRILLGNLGLDITRDVDQVYLNFSAGVDAFRRGEIDGLSIPMGAPDNSVATLLSEFGSDVRLLNWTEDQRARADGGLGLWSPITIPISTYPGQAENVETIAQPNLLAVRTDVDAEVVYQITKTIFENLPFLQRLHKPFELLSLDRALQGLPLPLHAGAVRYYQEVGLDPGDAREVASRYSVYGDGVGSFNDIREDVNRGTVTLITPEDSTSDRMMEDLLEVTADAEDLRVLPLQGRGAAHNLADLLYLNGVDIAILQADALERTRERQTFPNLDDFLRYITPLHQAELHLLVRDDVEDIEELRGRRVNFGPRGSGSELTASIMFDYLAIPVDQFSDSHYTALRKLKGGAIDAMVYVAGKPAPMLEAITAEDGIKLLAVPFVEFRDVYQRAEMTDADYPVLLGEDGAIETLAVEMIMASLNWPKDNGRHKRIVGLAERFLDSLETLQSEDYHPKWREVDPLRSIASWERLDALAAYLGRLEDRTPENTGQGGPLQTPAAPPIGDKRSQPAWTVPDGRTLKPIF